MGAKTYRIAALRHRCYTPSVCLAVVLLFFAGLLGEVASIVIVASYVGGKYTLIALVVAAALGALLLMGRAAATLKAAATAWAKGEPVGEVLAMSALTGFAGVLLIIPGFLSDVIALIFLLPPMRARLAGKLVTRLRARAQVAVEKARARGIRGGGRPSGGNVIDADGVEIRDPDAPGGPPALP